MSGKSNDEIAASMAAGKNPSELGAQPTVPPMATARSAAPSITNGPTYNLTINTQPGQDEKAFADAVIRRLGGQREGIRKRSSMFDGSTQ
ncbi:hypothetical protein NUV25_22440 [Burkholderia pseudomultivorans]|uniref:hypothetical protein n=1 Tax=Burkholderia pseudomultivorans TaxID=1207504 RepID=UPI00287616E4|nr:hypothetical protein [Burkholderia pseudomultivorans]MDS0860473.1 hypothetical protein [Burkholderia pseudomultivorans]